MYTSISSWSAHECIVSDHAYAHAMQEINLDVEHTSNLVRRLDEHVVGAHASDAPEGVAEEEQVSGQMT
jgi:hypothetical protein